MPSNLVESAWAPSLIGLSFSHLLYGISLGQSAYYVWSFPKDPIFIKLLVLLVLIADTLHLIGCLQFFWNMLLLCHGQRDAAMCVSILPWGAYVVIPANYVITFAVQSFYCHRIWIITRNKRSITAVVFLVAVSQFVLGIWAGIDAFKHGTLKFIYTNPLVPLAASLSTVCDIMITTTIFKYLWKSELRSRTNVIRDLVLVFVNMGSLTCLISITTALVFLAQDNRYWVGAPGVVLSRCYANSLLAVLNARRMIRERELRRYRYTIEIPTLSTII